MAETAEERDGPAPVMIERRAEDTGSAQPLLMATGADALTVCGDREDTARRLVCFAWITGASADNGWTQSLSTQIMPDFCAGAQTYSLGQRRDDFVAYLQELSSGALTMPAIIHFRKAMAEAFPCKEGTLEPAG